MRYLILLFMACCIAGHATEEIKRPTNLVELFGGQENLEIVRNAELADACILTFTKPQASEGEYEKLSTEERKAFELKAYRESYHEGEYRVIPADILSSIRAKLLNENTYLWNLSKACSPQYHSRLRFTMKGKIVTVDLCFSCEILIIFRNEEVVGGEDFDHDDGVLLRSMRALFPNDQTLKKIEP